MFENPSDTNSWRAEHIGKWLETACNAAAYSQIPGCAPPWARWSIGS